MITGKPFRLCSLSYLEGKVQARKELEQELKEAREVIAKATEQWCIKPQCKCYLCEHQEKWK